MATVKKGVWDLQQVRDQVLEGAWGYEETGYMYTWGYNTYGTLGLNDKTPYSSPVQVPGSDWSNISTGDRASLATRTDGTLWSWGLNDFGQLGQNQVSTASYRSSPTKIPGTGWYTVGSGYRNSFATKTDGTFWSWGYNSIGSLGQNDKTPRSSPVQIPGNQWNTDTLDVGLYGWLMTKTDGTLWTCGYNNHGQLGVNDVIYRSSPIQVPGTQWSKTARTAKQVYTNAALKTDGTLWIWGQNAFGGLGQNNLTYYSSPIQVPGTQWKDIAAGAYYTLATKTDNTLWAFGYGEYGAMAQNNNAINYSSPQQIPGTQWGAITASRGNNAAFKTDGTLWVWGRNDYGQLGINTWNVNVSSPIQLPGTQWRKIEGSKWSYNMVALKYAP